MRVFDIAVAAALALAVAAPASARAPSPGVWTVGEVQTICIRGDGTWYNMNFPITGQWKHIAPWTYFGGDYGAGGNIESHVAIRAHVGRRLLDLTDWGKNLSDDSEWFDVTLGMRFERVSRNCEIPADSEAPAGR